MFLGILLFLKFHCHRKYGTGEKITGKKSKRFRLFFLFGSRHINFNSLFYFIEEKKNTFHPFPKETKNSAALTKSVSEERDAANRKKNKLFQSLPKFTS